MVWATLFLIGGLFLLWRGADFLVDGAVGLAEKMGVSQLVAGLTIVAMGTSAPEVAAATSIGGRTIRRHSGSLLLAVYIAYLVYLLRSAGPA